MIREEEHVLGTGVHVVGTGVVEKVSSFSLNGGKGEGVRVRLYCRGKEREREKVRRKRERERERGTEKETVEKVSRKMAVE